MRRLEDGTYMYDTDPDWAPWVIALAVCGFWGLFGVMWFCFAFRVYQSAGPSEFYYLFDQGTAKIIWTVVSFFWFFRYASIIRMRFCLYQSGGSES
jgi:hypothetical protein